MAGSTIHDAASFLYAIKTATDYSFDDDAVEYLERLSDGMFAALDARGVKGRQRDRIIFFDAMAKGVILKLRKRVLETRTELQDANLLKPDGTVKGN